MRRSLIALVLIAGLAPPAEANDCPDAQTSKAGFVLERRGTRAEIRPAADHFVHVLNLYPGGKRQDVIYYRGLFVVSRFDDTARHFNIPLSDLRTIFPLAVKTRRAVTYAPALPGKVGSTVSLEMVVTGQEKLQLGACAYNVLVIRNKFMNTEGRVTYEETDLYSPELGFLLGKRYDERGGGQTTNAYESIKPLTPSQR